MDSKAIHSISHGLYVVGTKLDGKYAGCIVDAFVQSTNSPVPTVILCSIKANQTNAAIKETEAFAISVLGTNVDPFVIGNFGFQSGRKVDKWSNVPHKIVDGLPVLEDACAYLCCKVTDSKELSTHTAFFCEVTDAWLGEGEPIIYANYQKNMKAKTVKAFKAFKDTGKLSGEQKEKWVCQICGYVYDGDLPFEQLPGDWKCPICGHPKNDFQRVND